MIDEVGFARAMRDIENHEPQVQVLVEELLRRVRHPSLARHPQSLFIRSVAEDISHSALRLAKAAGDLAASVDRRRPR